MIGGVKKTGYLIPEVYEIVLSSETWIMPLGQV
jgi:hypothetical protein